MTMTEAINFDGMTLGELYAWADRYQDSPLADHRKLARYVHPAIAARIARERGDITAAKVHEDYMERIYRNLPEHLRW
jgi:hypothetical protein